MLHTEFQASEPSGSEEEDFLIFFLIHFYDLNLGPPRCRTILDPLTFILLNLIKDHYAKLHTKFPASKPSNSEKEDFLIFSMYFYGLNLGPPGMGPSWILGPLFEQNW